MEDYPSQPVKSLVSSTPCNCKYSKCLKLYCECFSSGEYCQGCNCVCCQNVPEREALRLEKIQNILKRDPLAFRPKIPKDPLTAQSKPAAHFRGCTCRKTKCNKKYCECFNAGIPCIELCKCSHCKNKQVVRSEEKNPLRSFAHLLVEGWDRSKDEDGKSEGSTLSDEVENFEKFERLLFESLCKHLSKISE